MMEEYLIPDEENFWGHAGIEFAGMPQKMWPISAAEMLRLEGLLSSGSRISGWLAVQTLNNRMLLINPTQWERFSLVDDAKDWPEGGYIRESSLNDYSGMPADLYRGMAEWADGDGELERNSSTAMKKQVLAAIERGGFLNRRNELRVFLRYTVIHYVSGRTKRYEAERADLYELIEIEGDVDAGTAKICESEGVEQFYSLDKLRMIEIPMIELEAARQELARDLG